MVAQAASGNDFKNNPDFVGFFHKAGVKLLAVSAVFATDNAFIMGGDLHN